MIPNPGRVRSRNDMRASRVGAQRAPARVAPDFDLRQAVERSEATGAVQFIGPNRPISQHSYSFAVPESVRARNNSQLADIGGDPSRLILTEQISPPISAPAHFQSTQTRGLFVIKQNCCSA